VTPGVAGVAGFGTDGDGRPASLTADPNRRLVHRVPVRRVGSRRPGSVPRPGRGSPVDAGRHPTPRVPVRGSEPRSTRRGSEPRSTRNGAERRPRRVCRASARTRRTPGGPGRERRRDGRFRARNARESTASFPTRHDRAGLRSSVPHVRRSTYRTMETRTGDRRTTVSATLPSGSGESSSRPWLPMTM